MLAACKLAENPYCISVIVRLFEDLAIKVHDGVGSEDHCTHGRTLGHMGRFLARKSAGVGHGGFALLWNLRDVGRGDRSDRNPDGAKQALSSGRCTREDEQGCRYDGSH